MLAVVFRPLSNDGCQRSLCKSARSLSLSLIFSLVRYSERGFIYISRDLEHI